MFTDSGETFPLDPETLALLERCDGTIPAHSLGANSGNARKAGAARLHPLGDGSSGSRSATPSTFSSTIFPLARRSRRTRWLEQLQPLAALAAKFARVVEPLSRLSLIEEATERLENSEHTRQRLAFSILRPIPSAKNVSENAIFRSAKV